MDETQFRAAVEAAGGFTELYRQARRRFEYSEYLASERSAPTPIERAEYFATVIERLQEIRATYVQAGRFPLAAFSREYIAQFLVQLRAAIDEMRREQPLVMAATPPPQAPANMNQGKERMSNATVENTTPARADGLTVSPAASALATRLAPTLRPILARFGVAEDAAPEVLLAMSILESRRRETAPAAEAPTDLDDQVEHAERWDGLG